jgi:hypothetical protein
VNYFQQGDVLIKPVSELPHWQREEAMKRDKQDVGELVVAQGETTGHSHVIRGKIVKFVPKQASNNMIVFELTEPCTISHEEHNTITLPAGTYYIDQVREFDHFENRSQFVRD